jgi:F-type H+-transporting ATPase subunit delta
VIPSLQGYLAAVGESLVASGALGDTGAEMGAVADLVERNGDLLLVVVDGSVAAPARRAVLADLLEGRVRPEVRRLVDRAVAVVPASDVVVSFRWMADQLAVAASRPPGAHEPDDEPVLGKLGARNRVTGYAAAVFENASVGDLEEIEDQLFRFARTVEANRPLRTALGDRDLPVAVRQQLISDLLDGRALPAAVRLARYAARGGRARDFVSLLDTLVEAAATARGWRVARVRAAAEVDDRQRDDLAGSLRQLTGGPVELHVTVNPDLLGGAVVEIGDLLVDGSARHRLDQLKEHVLVAGAAASASSLHETAPVHEGRTEGREHT